MAPITLNRENILQWMIFGLIETWRVLRATFSGSGGRVTAVTRYVEKNSNWGDPEGVLNAIDTFSYDQRFLMNVGDEKGAILLKHLREVNATNVLELGAYCGYSAVLMGQELAARGGRLTSVEVSRHNAQMARRIVAAAEFHQLSNANVGLWEGITLSSDTDVDWLLQNTEPWRLVVIDTLSKATSGIDENSNAEMALAIERAYRLANAWNCFVAIVAHTGKDETRGTRGASALKANVDSVLAVRRSGNSRHVSLTIEKQKDADDHLQLDFKMEATEVIHTETGEVSGELVPVTTGSNPSADACIRIALARDPELAIAGLVLAVTEISRAGCYRPVTPSAIKVAAGRAVKAGTVVKIGEKYSLSPDAAR